MKILVAGPKIISLENVKTIKRHKNDYGYALKIEYINGDTASTAWINDSGAIDELFNECINILKAD